MAAPALAAENAAALAAAVQKHALQAPPPEAVAAYLAMPDRENPQTIRAFLASFDPWAQWTPAEEAQEGSYLDEALGAGVGMDVVQSRNGDLVCLPYPGSPAAKAGIGEGDLLLAVDGFSARGAALDDVAVLVRGQAGTVVRLLTQKAGAGQEQEYTLTRQVVRPPHVELSQEQGFWRVRIFRFNRETSAEFAQALARVGKGPLVFDLRGNSGGLVSVALACASHVLKAGIPVYQSRSRLGEHIKRTAKDGDFAGLAPIVIWQDGITASAAELFVAALTDNGRGVSMGTTTFGKGRAQDVFSINGSQLVLSTEELLRGKNGTWEGQGLKAHIPCDPAQYEELAAKSRNFFGIQP